jgi:hypothetical protein
MGALSKPQSETKPAAPAKATTAPLLIAPNSGKSSVAAAMDAPPPATPAPAPAATTSTPPTAKLPPVKSEAVTPPTKVAAIESPPAKPVSAPQPESLAKTKGGSPFYNPALRDETAAKPDAAKTAPKPEVVAEEKPKLKIPSKKPGGSPFYDPSLRDEETVVISSTTPVPEVEKAREFIPASLSGMPQTQDSGSMIDRPMTAGEKNIAQRFEVLKTLLDEGLITPEEYSRHRAANIGAMLPLTHDPGSAGLERPSANADAIVARLQALRRALEIRAISTQQHASERAMILMALLPARPDQLAPPVQPPADVIQGAAMTSRLTTLKSRNLISADEYESERKAIDQYLRTGSFKGGKAVADADGGGKGGAVAAPAKDAKDAKAGKKDAAAPAAASEGGSDTDEVTGPVLHLASFRTKEAAEKAWQEALGQNKSILANYRPVIRKIDLGGDKGKFFRLMVGGFPNLAEAESTCIRLKANNQFCRPASSAGST